MTFKCTWIMERRLLYVKFLPHWPTLTQTFRLYVHSCQTLIFKRRLYNDLPSLLTTSLNLSCVWLINISTPVHFAAPRGSFSDTPTHKGQSSRVIGVGGCAARCPGTMGGCLRGPGRRRRTVAQQISAVTERARSEMLMERTEGEETLTGRFQRAGNNALVIPLKVHRITFGL